MKRMLLTISYDGTAYHGWQVQPNGVTVQETVQNALEEMLGERPALTGCSRTDAGVHARQFCCHFDCGDAFPEKAFIRGLNGLLPRDIAVLDCKEVEKDFHARYRVAAKTYCYFIRNTALPDPFAARYCWQIERPLDTKKMDRFCRTLVGTHDFFAFSSSGRTVEDTVRTVSDCSVKKEGDKVIFTVTANGFLYNMVRIMVGTAVAVSDGRIPPDAAKEIFEKKDRALAGETAPAKGLFLEKVSYRGVEHGGI